MTSQKKFRNDYGVFVCEHVFKDKLPVLEAVRDPDGYWQFFCGGEEDFENSRPRHIGIGHLTNIDPSIHELTCMEPGQFAERSSVGEPWHFGNLGD